jgi:hypothetical protein
MKLRTLAVLIALSSLLTTSISFGWDAEVRNRVRDMPIVRQTSFTRSPRPWVTVPGHPEYDSTEVFTTNLKDRVGGLSADPGDTTSANNFYVCPPGFVTTGGGSNLSGCKAPESVNPDASKRGRAISGQWAWLRARKTSDDPTLGEHYLIAKAVANLAGLSRLAIFEPFWVRYPTQNAYLASPLGDKPSDNFLVSQSWQPASNLLSSTQALRSISLLDLAQLPDNFNNLADWAEGNELCPLSGLEGAFSGSLVQNCHDFGVVMGAINATHFAPLNRQSWQYYHSLAMQRMAQCSKLARLIQPFYTANEPVVCAPGTPITQCDPMRNNWYQVMHGNATEMHECEREAMAYEMVAQHFMHDAWSSGHMWKRWGKANFSQFDSEFPEYSGSADVPVENHAPRRAAIAVMTAAISGEIHGAKPIMLATARGWIGPVADGIFWLGVGDDPLCGPTYNFFRPPPFDNTIWTRDVEWRSTAGTPFPGAGDLFWAPLASSEFFPASVSLDDKYREQRSRLLECAAASMLEAYNASGALHAYGEPVPDPSLAGIKPGDDGCWDHWATNEAMQAAVGVSNYAYYATSQITVANIANTLVLKDRKNKFSFVKDGDTNLVHYAERRADRVLFFTQLEQRMNRDMASVLGTYTQNAAIEPKGLQSAHGLGSDGLPITMLGVGPIDTPPPSGSANAEPPTPPTDYSDRLVRQDASDYAPSDAGSLGNAMSQLFWRGNVERTCRTSLLNDARDLLLLREKCMAKAAGGGNPDACTACVEIAELHVPNVSYGQDIDIPVGDSKCSALGVTMKAHVPGGLPAWWFDNVYRWNGQYAGDHAEFPASDLDHPAFDVALTWCTGAERRASLGGGPIPANEDITDAASDEGWLPARDSELSYEPTTTMTCTDDIGQSYTVGYGISHRRHAQAFIDEYNRTTPNWVFPIVTAVDYTSELRPFGQCGSERVDSRTQRFEDGAGATNSAIYVPQSKVSHWFGGAAGISAPRCGVRQRMYYWNRPCQTALDGWKFPVPGTLNFFFPDTGTEVDRIEYGQDEDPANDFCLLREPRSFAETCPAGMKCNPDGECNADDQAAAVIVVP